MTQRRNVSANREVEPKRLQFSPKVFEALAQDLSSGRVPLPRVTITDPMTVGLRAIIRNTGLVSFHVHYEIGDSRPFMKIGDHPQMTVNEARELTRTIRGLADMGIDVQEGLHDRLIRELKEKGMKWRP